MPKDLFEEHGVDLLGDENPSESTENPGFLRSFGRGVGQSIGDVGASIANWPISGIEHFSGRQLPHVPHPHLINKNPQSLSESIAQNLGQLTGAIGMPGGAGLKAAQLANRGYQAVRAGKQIPMLGKLLASTSGGVLEGAAGNEENRGLGGVLGGLGGASGYAIPATIRGIQSMRSKNLAKEIPQEVNRLKDYFSEVFTGHLHAGEEAGANRFLKQEGVRKDLFKKAGESKSLHALDEFNMEPTLRNAHAAQSDLNKIISKYSHMKEPKKLDRDIYSEALKAKNRLLLQISNAFEKSGVKQHGAGYQNAREEYAHHLGPYLNSKAISALLGKGTKGRPTLRPNEFADKLLQEEEFLAQAGHKHPGLLRREKTKNALRNPLVKHALTALTAGTAAAFLPNEIRKLIGQ